MTDLRVDDAAFEQELRGVLADLAPNAAPGSLRSAVAAVPARAGRRGRSARLRSSPLPASPPR